MKKLLFGATLLIVSATSLSAQSIDHRELLEFGFKLGANVSNVWDSEGESFRADNKVGFAGGVFAGIPIGRYLGLQPELLFSQKGFKGAGSLLGFPYSFSRTTSFLDVPILLQLKPTDFITFVLGPQFSYLLRQNDTYTFGGSTTEQQREFENDNVRKNILGFVAGVDLVYRNALLSGRVGWDLQTNKGDGTSSTPRYKNQWLQIGVGFKL